MPINGVALGALAVGSTFLYSAVKGKSILATAQAIISGKSPATVPVTNQITSLTPNADLTSNASSSNIASIAESYAGKLPYVYGGPPPAGTVDCSSFVSKVLNQAGIANPGGSAYNANSHGPTTLSYIVWNGATTIGHTADLAQPGDLIVWQTHMGIAIGGGQYVSAQSPQNGVKIDAISFPGEFLYVRRLN